MKFTFPFSNALRGIGGEYEITRVLGGFGCMAYCVCANAFIGWGVVVEHREFDITAYCLAFPAGLAAIIAAAAGSASLKDRNVAKSKVLESTGAIPVAPPDGPPVPTDGMSEGAAASGEAASPETDKT